MPKPKPDERWWGFTPDVTDAEARALFKRRFGVEPAEIHRGKAIVLAGPIPERDAAE